VLFDFFAHRLGGFTTCMTLCFAWISEASRWGQELWVPVSRGRREFVSAYRLFRYTAGDRQVLEVFSPVFVALRWISLRPIILDAALILELASGWKQGLCQRNMQFRDHSSPAHQDEFVPQCSEANDFISDAKSTDIADI
jgi:hypothetical protein